mmetsp:Transcript_33201/g.33816  ORF Transcript_33201/g.33816 Transcript_33201/m.33816 type:complete len:98 (-) Transcript_33201:43-336(-)
MVSIGCMQKSPTTDANAPHKQRSKALRIDSSTSPASASILVDFLSSVDFLTQLGLSIVVPLVLIPKLFTIANDKDRLRKAADNFIFKRRLYCYLNVN